MLEKTTHTHTHTQLKKQTNKNQSSQKVHRSMNVEKTKTKQNETKQNKQQQQQMRFYALVGRPDVQILVYTCGFLGSPSNTVRRSGYCYCLGDETGSEKLGHLSKVTQL